MPELSLQMQTATAMAMATEAAQALQTAAISNFRFNQ
jgi:hypothetical protein